SGSLSSQIKYSPGNPGRFTLSDEKLYIEVRIFLSHLLQLSPGISRKQAFHHVQFLIQEKVRSMILSYLTSNKWFAA
ncbi:hypothetical protein, partial [Escherichia coli]|uniref:hypothetical protein n=1 Tax=Escherichia coli TaxID=562 RepID=UPI001BC85766